jgi:TRAP-type C4-dicarboxylate transport system substrate-binding protein
LEEKGMEFIEVDKAAFEKVASEAVMKSFSEEQKKLFKRIQEVK